jgi:hypothetical protein
MDANARFTTRANCVEELPEPFQSALRERLFPQDAVSLLAFTPTWTSGGIRSPATLLTLADQRWLLVADDERGGAAVVECAFEDTLLVELTEIFLRGQLKIVFAGGGMMHSCVIGFNTVTGELYREAVRHILRGIESSAPFGRPAAVPVAEMRPITFRNAVPKVLAEGRRPVVAVQWPAVFGRYGRELAPAAALLTTDRELVLISEKRTGIRTPRQAKYGYSVTYFPLARLAGFGFRRSEQFIILDLEMQASHGGETLQILFPPHQEQEVTQILECALGQSATSFSNEGASWNRSFSPAFTRTAPRWRPCFAPSQAADPSGERWLIPPSGQDDSPGSSRKGNDHARG